MLLAGDVVRARSRSARGAALGGSASCGDRRRPRGRRWRAVGGGSSSAIARRRSAARGDRPARSRDARAVVGHLARRVARRSRCRRGGSSSSSCRIRSERRGRSTRRATGAPASLHVLLPDALLRCLRGRRVRGGLRRPRHPLLSPLSRRFRRCSRPPAARARRRFGARRPRRCLCVIPEKLVVGAALGAVAAARARVRPDRASARRDARLAMTVASALAVRRPGGLLAPAASRVLPGLPARTAPLRRRRRGSFRSRLRTRASAGSGPLAALGLLGATRRERRELAAGLLAALPLLATRRIAVTERDDAVLPPTAFARAVARRDPESRFRVVDASRYRPPSALERADFGLGRHAVLPPLLVLPYPFALEPRHRLQLRSGRRRLLARREPAPRLLVRRRGAVGRAALRVGVAALLSALSRPGSPPGLRAVRRRRAPGLGRERGGRARRAARPAMAGGRERSRGTAGPASPGAERGRARDRPIRRRDRAGRTSADRSRGVPSGCSSRRLPPPRPGSSCCATFWSLPRRARGRPAGRDGSGAARLHRGPGVRGAASRRRGAKRSPGCAVSWMGPALFAAAAAAGARPSSHGDPVTRDSAFHRAVSALRGTRRRGLRGPAPGPPRLHGPRPDRLQHSDGEVGPRRLGVAASCPSGRRRSREAGRSRRTPTSAPSTRCAPPLAAAVPALLLRLYPAAALDRGRVRDAAAPAPRSASRASGSVARRRHLRVQRRLGLGGLLSRTFSRA